MGFNQRDRKQSVKSLGLLVLQNLNNISRTELFYKKLIKFMKLRKKERLISMNYENKKILIAYYSRKGNNYVNGKIVNLIVGNTKVAADTIQLITGGDLFEIDTLKPYPADYTTTTELAKDELSANARPELTDKVASMADYEIVFLGYPNWWGTMPMAVWSFLEAYDFVGKTIVPFCTNEGSGMGRSENDIRNLCPNANVKDGLAIRGSKVTSAEPDILRWLKK